jgi:hypothetical protein
MIHWLPITPTAPGIMNPIVKLLLREMRKLLDNAEWAMYKALLVALLNKPAYNYPIDEINAIEGLLKNKFIATLMHNDIATCTNESEHRRHPSMLFLIPHPERATNNSMKKYRDEIRRRWSEMEKKEADGTGMTNSTMSTNQSIGIKDYLMHVVDRDVQTKASDGLDDLLGKMNSLGMSEEDLDVAMGRLGM